MSDNDPNRSFSTSFPLVFLRLSYSLAEISRWFPNCFPKLFLWSSDGLPIVFSCFLEAFLMFFLWFYYCSHGSPVVFLWFPDAFLIVFRLLSYGLPVVLVLFLIHFVWFSDDNAPTCCSHVSDVCIRLRFSCALIACVLRLYCVRQYFVKFSLWKMQTEEQPRESHANAILCCAYIAPHSLSLAPARPARSRSSSSVIIIFMVSFIAP